MATLVPADHRGRAGGWLQVGILGGGALSAGITMWCAEKFGIGTAAFVLAAFAALPSLAALAIAGEHHLSSAATILTEPTLYTGEYSLERLSN